MMTLTSQMYQFNVSNHDNEFIKNFCIEKKSVRIKECKKRMVKCVLLEDNRIHDLCIMKDSI